MDECETAEFVPRFPGGYKVAFVGAHGVGKTTLCYELAACLKRRDLRVDLVKEVARECPLPLNQKTTIDAQAWILHTQIAREIEAVLGQDILVCDRSVLDNYAYLVEKFGRLEPFDSLVRHWLPGYGLLVWVPAVDGLRFDGLRDTDRKYQRRIETVIQALIETFEARPLRLRPDDRGNWIATVLSHLPRPAQLSLFREPEPGG